MLIIRRHTRLLLKLPAATAAAQLKLVLEISKGKVKIVQHTVCKFLLRARAAKYEKTS
jgi:predicted RNA-binding Zn ribbon-like protein